MLIAIFLIGFLFLGLIVKLAEGVLKLVLILIVIVLIILGSVFSNHNPPPTASAQIHSHVDAA